MNEIININNLSFCYEQTEKKVLNEISLTINQGELISIIGPNGCGKSTFVKQLNGILTPTLGTVKVLGWLTTDKENILNIRKNISMVFQNPDNQIVATIVEEDVAFALENIGVEPKEIRKRVDDALEIVGMSQYKKHATYQLSGGQKQRIAVASAFAIKPKCIVLDEPTSMLDPIGRKDILNLIKKLCNKFNITVIFVTHFMDEACLADRLIVMNKGKIIMDGAPRQIFANSEQLVEIGLELPRSAELCRVLKANGYDINQNVIDVDDATKSIETLLKKIKIN